MISEAKTDAERREVQALFEETFSDIDPNAVPPIRADNMYAPLVVRFIDPGTGVLAGAALTCRAQVAAMATMTKNAPGAASSEMGRYLDVLDKHRELDLMCVRESYRGRGIGGQLIEHMQRELTTLGIRAWFGNATSDLDVPRLRRFYARHGFTVLEPGQRLPPLLGRDWPTLSAEQPAFHFYKILKPANTN